MSFRNLYDYLAVTGTTRAHLAKQLGISRVQITTLLRPDRYVYIDNAMVQKIAEAMQESEDYVRKLYGLPGGAK